MKRKTTEQFIKDAKKVHGDKYDYSLVSYVNARTNIDIICNVHGKFKQIAYTHLDGNGCNKCGIELKSKNLSLGNNEFIKKSNKIHNNKYNYSLVKYINGRTKVKIICKEHGVFKQEPQSHLNGNGCPSCKRLKKLSTKKFIEISKNIHNNKYDYSLIIYNNMRTKVSIICKEHGIFNIRPLKHIHEQRGCPMCKESKGERKIRFLLESNNIVFKSQKRFKECKNINILPFDFYLPEHNICIEFDGIQHFQPMNIWGGKEEFKNIQKRDQIKNEYCENNNIRLIRIRYDEDIKEKLYLSVSSDSSFVSSAM